MADEPCEVTEAPTEEPVATEAAKTTENRAEATEVEVKDEASVVAELAEAEAAEKPKRPKNPYMLFCEEQRAAVTEAMAAKAEGKVKMADITKELTARWLQLDAPEKTKYQTLAAENKAKYDAAMARYNEQISEGKAKHDTVKQAAKRAYAESVTAEGLMRKPASAFFEYVAANRDAIVKAHNLSGSGAGAKKAAELWAAMSDNEKMPFVAKYEGELEAYNDWKDSPLGIEHLRRAKEQRQEGSTPTATRSRKRAAPEGESPEGAPVKKSSPPATKKLAKPTAALRPLMPAAVLEQCEQMGTAANGLAYTALLQKVLETEGLAQVAPEAALAALKRHGGLVNKTRSELLGSA